jgi:HK97 family phage portal protein
MEAPVARTILGGLFSNRAPVPYVSRAVARYSRTPPTTPTAGMEAQMRAVGNVGTLFAITDRIISTYSQVEWKLYRVPKDGRRRYDHGTSTAQDDRVEVTRHPALTLWRQPNDFFNGCAFRESSQQHEELVGEQFWVIVKQGSLPVELWFVRPDRMRPVPHPTKFLAGYIYTSPDGEEIPLRTDEVIFLRRPHPLDPYRGLGAVQSIMGELDSQYLSTEWNRNFFLNSATPGGVIEAEQNISDEDFDQFQARWAETHRGVANAHRVAILEAGMKWVDRRYTMDEMQFVEMKSASRESIREAFGFPKAMLGATDDVNKANAYAGEVMMARWLIKPRLMRVREVLNTVLLPMYGSSAAGLEFDFVNPVPEDDEIAAQVLLNKAQAVNFLAATGLWESADILSACGMPEMKELPEPRAPQIPASPNRPGIPPAREDTTPTKEPAKTGEDEPDDWLRRMLL